MPWWVSIDQGTTKAPPNLADALGQGFPKAFATRASPRLGGQSQAEDQALGQAWGSCSVSAMQRVRERTARFMSVTINDTDALMIALTCATMEYGELLELSHDRIISVL